jgi:hypothetical protein
MKKIINLLAIALVSSTAFASLPSSDQSSNTAQAMASAWKHQTPMTIGTNNLKMVYGGEDISSKSMLEGPTASV